MADQYKQIEIKTKRPTGRNADPRLPHERDESDDSQASPPRPEMQQAAADIESGQVDTDRRNIPGVEAVKSNVPVPPGQLPENTRGTR